MTTPNGAPTGASPGRPRGYAAGDAAVQANPTGGGQFTGGSEAKVIGDNQDKSSTGAADATSALGIQKSNMANQPGTSTFTADD
jgi:hypothetical protein